jgi:alpha-beta hydrolase superfamily lysophospholipase
MIKSEFTFLSSDNKTNIYYIICYPKDGKFNKIFQMVHGMLEYIERYLPFFEYLTSNGFLVVGHDHLGHGKSINTKEDLGYFGEPNPNDLLIKDIHKLRLIIQEKYSNFPYFIGGHSMGSYLLRQYISIFGEGLKGAIILGTGYEYPVKTLMGLNFCKIMSYFKGAHHRSNLVKKLCLESGPFIEYDMTKTDIYNSWITSDPEMAKLYNEDKKMDFNFTLNAYIGLIEATKYSCNYSNIKKIRKNLPILLISGDCDPVGNNGKGVKKVYELMKSAGILDVSIKLFENDRHEILNEVNRNEVYKYVKNWLSERC